MIILSEVEESNVNKTCHLGIQNSFVAPLLINFLLRYLNNLSRSKTCLNAADVCGLREGERGAQPISFVLKRL